MLIRLLRRWLKFLKQLKLKKLYKRSLQSQELSKGLLKFHKLCKKLLIVLLKSQMLLKLKELFKFQCSKKELKWLKFQLTPISLKKMWFKELYKKWFLQKKLSVQFKLLSKQMIRLLSIKLKFQKKSIQTRLLLLHMKLVNLLKLKNKSLYLFKSQSLSTDSLRKLLLLKEILKSLSNAHKLYKRLLKLKWKPLKLRTLLKRYQYQLFENKLEKLKKQFLISKLKSNRLNYTNKK